MFANKLGSPKCMPYLSGFWKHDRLQKLDLVIMVCLLLLLLLSRFSRVWLCATLETAAQQAPPSLGFSRQEHWNGLPFPSPVHESEKWKWSRSVMSDSSDPTDCSPPGSSVHGIFRARVLEWGAIAFSGSVCYQRSNPALEKDFGFL